MASVNKTHIVGTNGSGVWSATYMTSPGSWPGSGDHWMSLAFVNFVLALLAFSIRYAAVFWYTNKALTLVFALQLFTLTLTAVLGYPAFSCLHKVCANRRLFLNVRLALGCPTSLSLYLLGSALMLLSTFIVSLYASRSFREKMSIIQQRHHRKAESFLEASPPPPSTFSSSSFSSSSRLKQQAHGCQVYTPHMCALGVLVLLVACKGPVMYELVRLYRPTQDSVVLTGVVCEVVYLALWIGLWFVLTVKQQWQFRILDYMSLGQSLRGGGGGGSSSEEEEDVLRRSALLGGGGCGSGGGGGGGGGGSGQRRSRSRDGCFDIIEMQDLSNSNAYHYQKHSRDPLCSYRESSEHISFLPNGVLGHTKSNSLPNGRKSSHGSYMNVQAELHDVTHSTSPSHSQNPAGAVLRSRRCSGEGSNAPQGGGGSSLEKQRRKDNNAGLTESFRDYRNSIRSKCDDLYTTTTATADYRRGEEGGEEKSPQQQQPDPPATHAFSSPGGVESPAHDPLPTLMSSFRDKVKESSRAANTYRQQRCSLNVGGSGSGGGGGGGGGGYGSFDRDSRPEQGRGRVHVRNGSWTPPRCLTPSSLERHHPQRGRTHVRSSSWTHQPAISPPPRPQAEGTSSFQNQPKPKLKPLPIPMPVPRPGRPNSSQGSQDLDMRLRPQAHKSHSLPHSSRGGGRGGRGRPRNNSLPSTPRRGLLQQQQVSAVYSLADQMARLRGNHRQSVPTTSREAAPSPGTVSCIAAPLGGSGRLTFPQAADLASCPFKTSRGTSTSD